MIFHTFNCKPQACALRNAHACGLRLNVPVEPEPKSTMDFQSVAPNVASCSAKGRDQFGLRQFIAALPCGTRRPFCNEDRSQRALKNDLLSCVKWKAAMNRRSPNGKSRSGNQMWPSRYAMSTILTSFACKIRRCASSAPVLRQFCASSAPVLWCTRLARV